MRFDTMIKIKRALISVYDKRGIVPFAQSLHRMGVEIISTGGTAKLLKKEGLTVKEVSDLTRFPDMLDGRVKTLHPHLHAGLLAVRDNPHHLETLRKHKIRAMDLLVVNLYPFWDAVRTKRDENEIVEMVDIGGPAMLRSAAKNFRFVAAVSDPADYGAIQRELEDSCRGAIHRAPALSDATSRRLAAKVFGLTSRYDGMIRDYFNVGADLCVRPSQNRQGEHIGSLLPDRLTLDFKKTKDLRYGENPHQKGALYAEVGATRRVAPTWGIVGARQLHGKELSFNNILDLDAALQMASAFHEPACVITKHTNPCGFAIGKDARSAFKNACRCDPLSVFGSIVGFNRAVDGNTAKEILRSGFIECIIAENFTAKALKLLKTKKNLRLLSVDVEAGLACLPARQAPARPGRSPQGAPLHDFKRIQGGLLLQETDTRDPDAEGLQCVTKLPPSASEVRDLLFAFKVSRYVKSNAIVIARRGMTLGIGMGQPSRVDSCRSAIEKAAKRARGAVLASDGFFPKPDSIILAKKAGIRAIIQPGGSIQDKAVAQACDRARISMVFTGIRHFRH